MLKGTLHPLPDGTIVSASPTGTSNHGFLISAEVEDGTDITHLLDKLADALTWVEGVGRVEVDHLGEVDLYADIEAEAQGIINES